MVELFQPQYGHVVGTGGFTGPPQEGCVEIAYWTFKEFLDSTNKCNTFGVAKKVCVMFFGA
jgi:hypothetical protein